MTLEEYYKSVGCESFVELVQKLPAHLALRIYLQDTSLYYTVRLKQRPTRQWYTEDRVYGALKYIEEVATLEGVHFLVRDDCINCYKIERIEPLLKKDCTVNELYQLFNIHADIFNDTLDFQVKYGLMENSEYVQKEPYFIEKDKLMMKIGHLDEELAEIKKAAGEGNIAEFADGIIDLIYVASGLGNLCRLPMNVLWNDVQNSNMVGKERVKSLDNATKRGSTFDVKKTASWTAPRGGELIQYVTEKRQ